MTKKILVIDDDEDILSILDILFVEEGYEAILYNTGTTTEQIKILHPDLILLDVRINGFEKTGVQICAEIKNQLELNDIPVLLVSAEMNVDGLARSCGANGYINKPFDIDKLLSKVKEFIF
ncbi:response regulator receiver sensor signal transduction histidine kinase [Pedobacter sp. BAL39]|uniref:response regulator transcription factor n=1 Tax=Pedobacter sp. BAL39 TaxID=391596 RepID=UPI0001559B9F|nr:response regulator [Pedobacter sp. BAL39]EDM37782.1 response regulator receiver sensor signal transduction histidine kinase [Pedobacter sp. BAL39]